MRGWGLALALAVSAAVVSVAPVSAASKTVEMRATSFQPRTVEIIVDDSVEWQHKSGGPHTVTSDSDEDRFDSSPNCNPSLLGAGCINSGSYTHTFEKAGTFPYHCKVHGESMSGTVVVKPKAATPSPPPPGSAATTTSRPGSVTTTTRAAVTTTSRPLSTSSTVLRSTTTTVPEVAFEVEPNEPPAFDPGDDVLPGQAEASSKKKSNSDTVAVIVALLLAVASGGGFLLWRLRPRRG